MNTDNLVWFEQHCWGSRGLFPDLARLLRFNHDAFKRIVNERIDDYQVEQDALRAKGLLVESGANGAAMLLAQLDMALAQIKTSELDGDYAVLARAAKSMINGVRDEVIKCL
jgi:hypothetical protein